ncbi:GNAT family N-acetyltransferase [Bacillus sp. ISL-7]|uniref:GNAT family N-acetyltransferase n=1 Tax=Bacillus sp. ISL-7 TaxID=2819136 RepID=UPI001BEA758A|nr:GNAT family N-acetyltransferase [Bacillus sp. ISL-7]MBT2736533.1 GNAT family N-acetyltransferase [Bacillus sp. ISL-7]
MQLYFYDERYKNDIEQYQLSEEQLRFTGTPTECIKLSNEDPDRYSILAMDQENLVTFFNLHKNEGVKPFSNNDRSILLRAFSTDFRHQGKGYAKNVLLQLPSFVKEHFIETNEIVLAVNLQNTVAQGLYKKCGFIDEGERRMGSKGELIIMSYHL